VLEQFVDAEQIEPALFSGRSLYLVPQGLAAQRPYLVLARGNRASDFWLACDMYPERYRVKEFPDEEQLRALGCGAEPVCAQEPPKNAAY